MRSRILERAEGYTGPTIQQQESYDAATPLKPYIMGGRFAGEMIGNACYLRTI